MEMPILGPLTLGVGGTGKNLHMHIADIRPYTV